MLVFAHISLVLSIIFFVFSYTLFREYKNSGFHKANILLFIFYGLFFLINSLMAMANNQEEARMYSRFLFTSHFILPFIIESVFYITEKKPSFSTSLRRILIFSPFLVLAFLDIFFPGLTIDLPKETRFGWVYVNKTESYLFLFYSLTYLVAVSAMIGISLLMYFKTENKIKQNFLLLFVISYLLPVGTYMIMTGLFKQGTEYNIPFLSISGSIGLLLIWFFIRQYSIFDISLGITTNDILSNISNMMFLLDNRETIIEINHITQNKLQLKNNKYLNVDFSKFMKEPVPLDDIISGTLQGKEFRTSLVSPVSAEIPVILSASRIEKKGQFIGYMVIATDVSDEQKLNDEKRIYELEIKALQSQMNPAFILNSLSSVNHLMGKGDDSLGKQYIAKLADLFKMILEQTGEHLITVEEEIDILETYLQVEKQRSDIHFNYDIQVDKESDPYLFEIPPMIVQPFVENAIIHGFTHSDHNQLTVIFSGDEESLNITIKDNGIGISTRKNLLQDNNHRGISTIRERLSLYNKYSDGYESMLTIVNNKDINPSDSGTTVNLTFKKNMHLIEDMKIMAN